MRIVCIVCMQAMAEFHAINAQHLPNHVLLERLAERLKGDVDRSSVALEAAKAAAVREPACSASDCNTNTQPKPETQLSRS